MIKIICFIVISFFATAINSNAQNLVQRYDLNFQGFNECSWDWLSYKKNCTGILDALSQKNAIPVLKLTYDSRYGVNDMEFILSKSIILPETKDKVCDVTLALKNNSNLPIVFKLTGIDNDESIIFEREISIEDYSKWTKGKISLPTVNIEAINIDIKYKGNKDEKQIVWLKNIGIHISPNDVDRKETTVNKLDPNLVVNLADKDSLNFLNDIQAVKGKKIIGLGENVHGSLTIGTARLQFLKHLILKQQCKLVLLERSLDASLLFDLYVQGKIAEKSDVLDQYLRLGMDYQVMKEFLKWLRLYNITAENKVHIFGVDNTGIGDRIGLMDYHLGLLEQEKGEFYIKKVKEDKIKDILEFIKTDTTVKQLLDEKSYTYYLNLLSEKFSKNFSDRANDREPAMFKRVAFLDSLFTKSEEKTVILAHAVHLQKIKILNQSDRYDVLGNLLKEKYGDKYYALDFNFGGGSFIQDSCSIFYKLITDTLGPLPKNSFEYVASQTGSDYFFYPSKYLDKKINTTAYILRSGKNKNHFKFASLQDRFDGFVFLKKSEPFIDIENEPFSYGLKFFDARRAVFFKVMQSHQNKQ